MPRKKLIRTSQFYYHVTTRSNNREVFPAALNEVWEMALNALSSSYQKVPVIVSQFVLMNNHYHLLVRTPEQNIDTFMYWFNRLLSHSLRKSSGRINQMFGSNYKWSIIEKESYLFNVYRYIYQNPVRANICSKCHQYPYSTHYYSFHKLELPFPFDSFQEWEKDLEFLNTILEANKNVAIKKGLQRSTFKEVHPRSY